mgnify:CR=1 FL=1
MPAQDNRRAGPAPGRSRAQQAGGGQPIGFADSPIHDRFATRVMYHDVTDDRSGRNVDLAVAHLDFNNGFDDVAGLFTTMRGWGVGAAGCRG